MKRSRMMMMTQFNHEKRGDLYNNRLFSSLLSQKGLTITQIHHIKENVLLLETDKDKKILKGFRSKRELFFQFYFINTLNRRSPDSFIAFEYFPDGNIFFKYNHRYWGLMTFVNGEQLHFAKKQDQRDAFYAVRHFHKMNQGMEAIQNTRYYIGLIEHYESRLRFFTQAVPYLPDQSRGMFNEILNWGNYSLTLLSQEPIKEMEAQAIQELHWIHGDLADHNFIRSHDKQVFLIDFDLVAIAPQPYDDLQLSHRILVNNGWDIQELLTCIPTLEHLLCERWFLCALLFPNDLIREWKHWFSGRLQINKQSLLEYSERQFTLRSPVVREIIHMLD